ncbi:LysM peptidoglycan-binding domain-containing protein [Clostridiaceae bacterium 35-E11]
MYSYFRKQCPLGTVPHIIQPGDTFYGLAKKYNTSISALISANPSINPGNLFIGQTLCIPRQQIYPPCPEGNYYTIRSGDALYAIARAYNISIDDLIEANPGINPYILVVGQVICIPLAVPPVTCPEGNSYVIQRGDTFYKIAKTFNISLDDLLEANPMIDPDRLLIGQTICIPLATPPVKCPTGSITYIVKAGDTFAKLSQRFNTTIAEIQKLNPTVNPQTLLVGQSICIPKATATLPATREIPVFVEGETEYRRAVLEKSPQKYYLYVLDNFKFTPEEPGKDLLFSTFDDRFFVRIEKLPRNVAMGQLRANAMTELQAIGIPQELKGEAIFDPFFRTATFFLHASNPTVSKNIIVINIEDSLFRFTMHIPNVEAAEGISPSFYAMLKTIGLL